MVAEPFCVSMPNDAPELKTVPPDSSAWMEDTGQAVASRLRQAPEATVTLPLSKPGIADAAPTASTPSATVVLPAWVFEPDKRRTPAPVLVRPPAEPLAGSRFW